MESPAYLYSYAYSNYGHKLTLRCVKLHKKQCCVLTKKQILLLFTQNFDILCKTILKNLSKYIIIIHK